MVHLDYVHSFLPTSTPVNVYGLLDSPLWLDLPIPTVLRDPERPYFGLWNQTQAVMNVAQPKHLDSACVSAHSTEQWRCLFGEYRIPFVKTPYLLVASQYDSFQLWSNLQVWLGWWSHDPLKKQAQQQYALSFAKRTLSVVKPLGGSPGFAMYSQACWDHSISLDRMFNFLVTSTDHRTSMLNALEYGLASLGWLPEAANATTAGLLWYDNCTGIACGQC